MDILPNLEIVDLGLYFRKESMLLIADTHIGQEEAMNKSGVLIPRFQLTLIFKRLDSIFARLHISQTSKLRSMVINGDIKHEFGRISETEWRNTLRFIDFISLYADEIILIKGNHDTIL